MAQRGRERRELAQQAAGRDETRAGDRARLLELLADARVAALQAGLVVVGAQITQLQRDVEARS